MEETSLHPFSQIISTLLKPLIFASKNNFTHLPTLRNVEALVKNLCEQALSIPDFSNYDALVRDLQSAFQEFDTLSLEEKKEKVKQGLEIIQKIRSQGSGVKGQGFSLNPRPPEPSTPSFAEVKAGLSKLSTPLKMVKGIGPKLAEVFKSKGLETVEDALYFLPIRYEDRRSIKKIAQLSAGIHEVAIGEIMAMGEVYYGRRKLFEMTVGDGSGFVLLKWFNYKLPFMKKRFSMGQRVVIYGEVGIFGGQKNIIHPDVEILEKGDEIDSLNFNAIVPVYSQIGNLHQKTVRKIVRNIVDTYASSAVTTIPSALLEQHALLPLSDAILQIHKPENSATTLARKSLVFDELFALELGLALKKKNLGKQGGISFDTNSRLVQELRQKLPFTLTKAQERVVAEIKKDMASPHPMNRLLQGDVGSGKTVVALVACLIAIDNKYQAAIMAPTEILAEQHFLNIRSYADGLGIKTALLTSSLSKSARAAIVEDIKKGNVHLAIGTHALIQEDVDFNNLGLIIIDEQHRFGVLQRAMLKKKGMTPDVLVMTATPIPRTLSMTVFGDLDVSIIDELPPGRQPIVTKVFREKERERVYKLIGEELKKGRQAYIVYPLIEESEELDLKDATKMADHLQKDIFPEYKIALLHGRIKSEEKEKIMSSFKARGIDILVSTTVIEVGIDVPNASVMVIEHAERFGLSQLHQLRGRVGRGGHASSCLLLAGRVGSFDTYQRLKVMEKTNDGFKIAEEDLNIRGPGDFLGTRQHGLPDFRIANLLTDSPLLQKARDEAFNIMRTDPEFTLPEHTALKEIIRARWKGRMELAEVG